MIPAVAGLISAGLNIFAGAVTAKGKQYVEDKLGVKVDDLLASDEGKIKLAELEMQHEQVLLEMSLKEKQLELDFVELDHKNTDSARDMQKAALAQEDKFSKRFVYYLATFFAVSSSAYIGFITFGTIPEANVRFADTILGFMLGTTLATILNFFFGSSNQSKVKDATLAAAFKELK